MPWVRLDDGFAEHPKMAAVGPLGLALQVSGLCYANRHLTDGYVPRSAARRMLDLDDIRGQNWTKIVQRLVDVGVWDEVEGGYQIHDYTHYQPSKADVLAERELAKRRWRINNDPHLRDAVRGRDGDICRYCGIEVNWYDRRSTRGGTYDHVIPLAQGGSDDVDNIVVSCRGCNSRKGARTPDQAGIQLNPPKTRQKPSQKPASGSSTTSSESIQPVPVPKRSRDSGSLPRAHTRDPPTPPVFNGDAHEARLQADEANPDVAEHHLDDIRRKLNP